MTLFYLSIPLMVVGVVIAVVPLVIGMILQQRSEQQVVRNLMKQDIEEPSAVDEQALAA
jgi:lipopolysaccharide export LptBFGC system permease protein LptF